MKLKLNKNSHDLLDNFKTHFDNKTDFSCVAQLNMIDIQTIFIKMWIHFFKLYG